MTQDVRNPRAMNFVQYSANYIQIYFELIYLLSIDKKRFSAPSIGYDVITL